MKRKLGSKLVREIVGVISFAGAFLLTWMLLADDPGHLGRKVATRIRQAAGAAAFIVPIFLLHVSFHLFRNQWLGRQLAVKLIKTTLEYAALIGTASLFLSQFVNTGQGGDMGRSFSSLLVDQVGGVGSSVIALCLLVLCLMLVSRGSIVNLTKATFQLTRRILLRPAARHFVAFRQTATRAATWLLGRMGDQLRQLRENLRIYIKSRKTENTKKEQDIPIPESSGEPVTPQPAMLQEPAEEVPEPPRKRRPSRAPVQQKLPLPEAADGYSLPPLHLLDASISQTSEIDRATVDAGKVALQKKLEDLGIIGKVVDPPQPGPVITMYRFDPDPGVKVRRIVALADDLSMALKAFGVRVLAPIPGESVVGIEVPNPRRDKIFLKEIIESEQFKTAESALTLALGKRITGESFVDNLARMPHLLVAGATGTGKSVSLNAMILSILFKSTPGDVRFIMIDPKMLELAIYEDIPHLLVPVVTDPKKASNALFWAMEEMDRRYRLMREKGARNIDDYNRRLDRKGSSKQRVVELKEEDTDEERPAAIGADLGDEPALVHHHLPRIVIIIDELADLMMTVRRDIEEYITRLAQKARAAGIHLIMATQRPSVDVITGLIKANFPARISFQVTSRVDSRTILDSIGAERLLGNGDMLFLPPGTARLIRVHGAYVSDHEVRQVVNYIKGQGQPDYRHEILEVKKADSAGDAEDLDDDIYDQAVAFVAESQQASISMIQRKFRIGYNRAARLIERMEKEGKIGPGDGARPREVYVKKVEAV